jgi:predicted Zn-dependent peptidase
VVCAVAGPFDAEWALDTLSSELCTLGKGGRPSMAAPAELEGPRLHRVMHRASQTEVTLGFRAPGIRSEDEASMDLLSRILDDGMATRLYHQLCDERGLCYDVSGTYESYADSGLLELFAETGHERVVEVVEQLLGIVTSLKQSGPSDTELSTAKQRHRWQLEAMLDSPSQVAEYFLGEELAGTEREPLERAEQLGRVSVDDVVATARKWLTRERLCLLLLGFPKRGAAARVERLVSEFA